MFKKIISVILALCIALGCFSVMAVARSVGTGGGAESFNPVEFRQEADAIGSTKVNTNLVATIINMSYNVEINTISAEVLFKEEGDTSSVTVSYESGTLVKDEMKFPITGEIYETTNSAVRYTINYDIIDRVTGKAVWKDLTAYTYGVVSGSEAVTGEIGTYPEDPGRLDEGAYFTSLDKLNTCYVQVPSKEFKYALRTQSFFFTFRERTSVTSVTGNAPPTLRTYDINWPSVQWYKQTRDGTWLMWSTPDSGYYSFTLDMNSNNTDWEQTENTVTSTEMYYLDDWDRSNAKTLSENILGVYGVIGEGYYVQKDRYTEESWNDFLDALDMANQVIYAVPGANYGFKVACENGTYADNNLKTAFNNLVEAPCDWTAHKDPVLTESSVCGGSGTMTYTCICGKTKTESVGTVSCTPSDKWTVIYSATCTTKGQEAQLCTKCRNPVNYRDIEPLGHDYQPTIVHPDCVNEGYTIYTCSRCDNTYNSNYSDPLGHTEGDAVTENFVNATCTREGSYDLVTYCKVCDAELSRTKVTTDVLPHIDGEWIVIKEPGVRDPGIEALCCAVCEGQTGPTKEIEALDPYFLGIDEAGTVVDEKKGIVYGLPPEPHESVDGYINYDGGEGSYLEFIPTENGYGTGTTINFIIEEDIYSSYTLVIKGDFTGDGWIDDEDLSILESYVNGDITFEEDSALECAADFFFREGVGDTYDLALLYAVIAGEADPSLMQSPILDIMEEDRSLAGEVDVTTVLSENKPKAGDIVTVTVKLSSPDYILNAQIPVLFDKTQFEIVGDASGSDYLSFAKDSPFADRNYQLNGKADNTDGFAKTADDDKWNTNEAMDKYGYAFASVTYNSLIGAEDTDYVSAENAGLVSFKLKALTDVDDARKSVFVDTDWAKSVDNSDGLLAVGLKKSAENDIYTVVIHYEDVTYTTQTIAEAFVHNEGEAQIENVVPETCTESGSYESVIYCTCCTPAEELSRELVITDPAGHTPGEVVQTETVPAVGSTNAYYELITYCSVCEVEMSREKVEIEGAKVWGTLKSFPDNKDNVVTVEFYIRSGNDVESEPAYTFTVEGSGTVNYEFTNVNSGIYSVKVSKANHATRTYGTVYVPEAGLSNYKLEIQLIGDVTGDGKVNTIDVAKINSHAKNVSKLTGYNLECADVNGDGKVNTIDVARVNSHAKNVSKLW